MDLTILIAAPQKQCPVLPFPSQPSQKSAGARMGFKQSKEGLEGKGVMVGLADEWQTILIYAKKAVWKK